MLCCSSVDQLDLMAFPCVCMHVVEWGYIRIGYLVSQWPPLAGALGNATAPFDRHPRKVKNCLRLGVVVRQQVRHVLQTRDLDRL